LARVKARSRSKLETFIDVLEVIKGGISKPTRIMSRANLSWQPLTRILSSMVNQGFVREIDVSDTGRKRDKRTTKLYEITMKGDEIVKHFRGGGNGR
jgi:predicted transcriptional regulator